MPFLSKAHDPTKQQKEKVVGTIKNNNKTAEKHFHKLFLL